MSLEFYSTGLDTAIGGNLATLEDEIAIPTDMNATATCNIGINTVRNVFQYYPYENADTEPNFRMVIDAGATTIGFSTTAATVTDGFSSSQSGALIGLDWTHYLAVQMFNNWKGEAFFDNPASAADLETAFSAAFATVAATAATASSQVAKSMFASITNSAPTRLTAAAVIADDGAGLGWYKIPIAVGDTISFKLTVSAHADQEAEQSPAATTIADHVYLFKGVIVN